MSLTRNDAAAAGRAAGIATSFSRAANIPTTREKMKLANGIIVDRVTYEHMGNTLKGFARDVAAMPGQIDRLVQSLGHRLTELHVSELQQYGDTLSKQLDKPAIDRWHEHRSVQRRRCMADPNLDISKSKNLVQLYAQAVGKGAADELRQMAERTGCGDEPAMHAWMNFVADRLGVRGDASKGPMSSKLYGADDKPVSPPVKTARPSMSSYRGHSTQPRGTRPANSQASMAKRLYQGG